MPSPQALYGHIVRRMREKHLTQCYPEMKLAKRLSPS